MNFIIRSEEDDKKVSLMEREEKEGRRREFEVKQRSQQTKTHDALKCSEQKINCWKNLHSILEVRDSLEILCHTTSGSHFLFEAEQQKSEAKNETKAAIRREGRGFWNSILKTELAVIRKCDWGGLRKEVEHKILLRLRKHKCALRLEHSPGILWRIRQGFFEDQRETDIH